MIPCSWYRCPLPASVSVDGWLFLDPIDYCWPHSEEFMAELRSMGWHDDRFPFVLDVPGATKTHSGALRSAA